MPQVNWERRRKNIRILLAAQDDSATSLAMKIGLSANTLSKFTNGSTETLSQKSMSLVVEGLGLRSASDLDTENPLNDPKVLLKRLIDDMPSETAPSLLRELRTRFANSSQG
jgi:hypothetical protein